MDTLQNARGIARQLLQLSQETENQTFIVNETGCMTGLVGYVNHEDDDVVLMSTRALQFLSSNTQCKKTMKEFPNLVENLTSLCTKSIVNSKAKEFAVTALDNLGVSIASLEEDGEVYDENVKPMNVITQNVKASPTKANLGFTTPTTSSSSSSTLGPYRTVTLQVDGIHDEYVRNIIERVLIKVSGVVSVTMDRERGRASIGTRRSDVEDNLIEALSNAGYQASLWPPPQSKSAQIMKGHNNKKNGITTTREEKDDDEDDGYLNEEDFDEKNNHANSGGALLRWGIGSLESRLEERRREEEERNRAKQGRLIGKVSSALSSAGSWLLGF